MAGVVSPFTDYYRYIMETKSDPRTAQWLLMSSPGPLFTILATYLYFCISAGPRYMKDRKPYELKNLIILYNAVQVAMSIFLVYEGLQSGWWGQYSLACQPVDYSNSPTALRMASAVWWYFFAKITELLDTVFFVLRKKNNQISFLHLYHHAMMPVCAWIGAKFLAGGHGTLLGLINSFIHIIMYSYYLISSMGPQYQKYLWWKRHLTALQMIQFCIIFIHNFQVLFRQCDYPKFIVFLLGTQAMFFFYLFGQFYLRTYGKSDKKIERSESSDSVNNNNVVKNGKLKTK
ncbi:elongation of very long chain fatty acids protein AAEL008004 [Agrilus planipennis]|uniref:Elongation of very long chain fatty acids protein n=1 Tax=Agrilus planipennis TaxID=224129 RepID=A0A1W4WV09_AGRPL|nr:elongation of very long chain fatty acids protein AAEL008004 [Agrilus planipennis]XP_018327716.1 elongation of very long chain fatty acids protein AAEL008004 [Agrilus planipennis]